MQKPILARVILFYGISLYQWRCGRRRGPGRPMIPRFLGFRPRSITFMPSVPSGPPIPAGEPIYMAYDEYEAFRLIYHQGLNQEEAAKRMKVSRGTVWRCLESARNKVARMLVERRPLVIAPAPIPQPSKEAGI